MRREDHHSHKKTEDDDDNDSHYEVNHHRRHVGGGGGNGSRPVNVTTQGSHQSISTHLLSPPISRLITRLSMLV